MLKSSAVLMDLSDNLDGINNVKQNEIIEATLKKKFIKTDGILSTLMEMSTAFCESISTEITTVVVTEP